MRRNDEDQVWVAHRDDEGWTVESNATDRPLASFDEQQAAVDDMRARRGSDGGGSGEEAEPVPESGAALGRASSGRGGAG